MKQWVAIFLTFLTLAAGLPPNCDVTANTEQGRVCGRKRVAANGDFYASFRGMRYAKAPLAELRFAEPQPPDPYECTFDASEHGPVCPQHDVIYGDLMQPRSSSEDCLRINVHVPLSSLPDGGTKPLLPVFVFIHGGSFSYGSGDADLHGPEYLMAGRGVILVTFNYRLGVFGFLSLFSKEIPGNAGLRDALFALKWVQKNIKNFGGDPEEVTLGGQSAGGVMAHVLAMHPAVQEENLIKRLIAISGYAIAGFFSYSKAYAKSISTNFLLTAGIPLASPADIHKELIKMPVDKLVQTTKALLDMYGIITFTPVVESPVDGFTTIVPKEPEVLLDEGCGKNISMWLTYCSNEAQTLKKRLEEVNIETKLVQAPFSTIPANIGWEANIFTVPILTQMMLTEYFNNTMITLDKFLNVITDGYYKYHALRVTEKRLISRAEPTYISEFGYHGAEDVFKVSQSRDWPGAGHCEDLTYFFRANSVLRNDSTTELALDSEDSRMKNWMTDLVAQFVKTGSPVPQSEKSNWPKTGRTLRYQNIVVPQQFNFRRQPPYLDHKKRFFDRLNKVRRGL